MNLELRGQLVGRLLALDGLHRHPRLELFRVPPALHFRPFSLRRSSLRGCLKFGVHFSQARRIVSGAPLLFAPHRYSPHCARQRLRAVPGGAKAPETCAPARLVSDAG